MPYFLLMVSLIFCLSQPGFAAPSSGVDWRNGAISATGVGVPPERARFLAQQHALACRAAIVDAQRNLLEQTQGVRIDSSTLVRDAMVESDIIRTRVEGIIKGARIVKRQLQEDGSCEVTLSIPMAGALFSTLIPEKTFRQLTHRPSTRGNGASSRLQRAIERIRQAGLISVAHASPAPSVIIQNEDQLKLAEKLEQLFRTEQDRAGLELIRRAIAEYRQTSHFTGVIIDARQVRAFNLAELPWIRSPSGERLYPNADTPYDVVQSSLPVAYDFDVDDAARNKRVATHPAVLRAVSIYKSRFSDLVLDEEASKRFTELLGQGVINKQARIMIVVHP